MNRLSIFFFFLAGLALTLEVLFFLNDTVSDYLYGFERYLFGYPAFIIMPVTLLLLLCVFSLLGYYFLSRQADKNVLNATQAVGQGKMDRPFYMMVAGLCFPMIAILFLIGMPRTVKDELGWAVVGLFFLSFGIGVLLIVFGIISVFLKRRK